MEQAVATELKLSRLVVHKLNQTFDSFQSHAFSVVALSEQWRNLQSSFAQVEAALSSRVKELDSRDRVLVANAQRIEIWQKEVQLRECSLVERSKEVEFREKEIKEFYEGVEMEKKQIRSHCEALKAKEMEIDARFRELELREKVLKESVMDERREVFLVMESDLKDRLEELKLRGDEMIARFDVRCKEVEDEHEEKKAVIDERLRELELKEKQLGEVFVLKEKDMDEVIEQLEWRRKELEVEEEVRKAVIEQLEWRTKVLEVEEEERKAVIEQLELRRKELEEEEEERKAVIEQLESQRKELEVEEEERKAVIEQLEWRRKELEVEQEERKEVIEQLESRRKELEVEEEKKKAVIEQRELQGKELEVEEEERKALIEQLESRRKELEVEEEKRKEVVEQLESRRKELEVEEEERKAFIEQFELRRKELEVEEEESKAVIEQLESRRKELEVEEEERKALIEQLESRGKELEVEEEERKALIEQFQSRQKELEESNDGLEKLKMREDEVIEKLESRRKELELEEEEMKAVIDALSLKEDQMEENCKALEAKEVKINERLKLLESKEKVKIVNCRGIELKERKMKEQWNEFETKEKQIKESLGNLELKEKKLMDDLQALELKEKQFDKEMELKEKEMKERGEAIEIKEKQIIRRGKAQELIAKDLELCKEENDQLTRRLEAREEEVKELRGALELKEKEIDDLRHSLEVMRNQIGHFDWLELKEREINERSRQLDLREEEDNQRRQALELKEKEFTKCIQHLEPMVNQVEEFCKEEAKDLNMKIKARGSKENPNDECCKGLKLKEKQVERHSQAQNSKDSLEVRSLCINMNANGLRSYLNNHVTDHNVLREDILSALRCASDPSKLAFDVCLHFHETNLTKSARNDNKSSCIYVLELLMMLNPNITPSTREEAIKYASFWMRRSSSPVDAFGFLQFLAAYKLAGVYKVEDLLLHLMKLYSAENLYLPEKHVTLCNVLGISDDIPDCIKSLIESNKRLDAIKFICVFKMEDRFPLNPLLKDHVKFVIQTAKERRRTENEQAKAKASNKEYLDLKAVLKCISKFKLQSQFKPVRIKCRITELQKERGIKYIASQPTQIKKPESLITQCFATSANEMAETNSCIKESSVPLAPTDTKSETWKKRNASSELFITSPEFPEKRARLQIPNQSTLQEPWPDHGPRTYGHPPYPMPDGYWARPHEPFLPSNGSHPHFSVLDDDFVVAPHLSTNQFVAPIRYPIDSLDYRGHGRGWEQPNMH